MHQTCARATCREEKAGQTSISQLCALILRASPRPTHPLLFSSTFPPALVKSRRGCSAYVVTWLARHVASNQCRDPAHNVGIMHLSNGCHLCNGRMPLVAHDAGVERSLYSDQAHAQSDCAP
jgi:hypothetical protein